MAELETINASGDLEDLVVDTLTAGNFSFNEGDIIVDGDIVMGVSAGGVLQLGSELSQVEVDITIAEINSGSINSAVTKEWVDAQIAGYSGEFYTSANTITVVNGLITAVGPLP